MPNIHIDIPSSLHKQLKIKSIKKGTTLKEEIVAILEQQV